MICPNCGTEHDAEYCPSCGQHRDAARLLPLRALAAETMGEILSLDSRVARTLKLLLLPLRLYIVVSAISIFLMAVTGYLSLEYLLEADREQVAQIVEMMGGNTNDPLFFERFESHYGTVFPIANLFSPVFLALALKAPYSRAYLHQHFVFALHTWTAINLVGTPILLSMRAIQQVAAILLLLFMATYVFLAQRRVYNGGRGALILRFGALPVMMLIATELISTAAFLSALLLASRS
ncbi:MAG: zinc ribbon domain-containing protein [Gemmatimonadota bacterium]